MKISLKSADGRVFEVAKDEIKQLKQLRTMLDAYEECEMTGSVVLDRVDGGSLAAILEWCQAFPDAEDFEPDLVKFTQAYRKFNYSDGERAFLEQRLERLWTLADAADYLDASRLRYSALQFLEEKISRMLARQIGKARALLALPHSMEGAYRKNSNGQAAVFDKELSKALSCQLVRFARDYKTVQRWRLLSPDWDRLITSEQYRIPRRVFQRVKFTPEGVVGKFNRVEDSFPTLSDASCLAIEELNVDFSDCQQCEIEDYINSESAKLHVQHVVCELRGKSDEQTTIFSGFLGRILCLELEMGIDLRQMKALTLCAVENALPCIPVVKLTVAASEPDTRHDPFAVFASIRDFYKAFVGECETGSLEITFRAINLPFKDLLEAIGEWFLLYGHFNVMCTLVCAKGCSFEQLDAFASLNDYQLTENGGKRRRYECKQTAGREMVLCASYPRFFLSNYTLEWTTSPSR
ncbi:hypothetical protein AAVH_28012 [Aphelenchoides avenae]|nr:hypothetical protein AAVH_28012 [Aphelenchus avenae]